MCKEAISDSNDESISEMMKKPNAESPVFSHVSRKADQRSGQAIVAGASNLRVCSKTRG